MTAQSVSEFTLTPTSQSTPTIRIYTHPSSHIMADEWDSIDDFSVDSLPVEESSSSSTAQSPFTTSTPEEIIKDELVLSEFHDAPRNSSSDFIQKMGHWLYNTRVVQYMKSDERARVKSTYSLNPIWMLGSVYTFTENGGSVNLPKGDRGEQARGGRASSLFNLIIFNSSEDEDEFTDSGKHHDHREEIPRRKLNKARSFTHPPSGSDLKKAFVSSKPKSSIGGSHAVIRRLRSLSFTRKSPSTSTSPDRKSVIESSSSSSPPSAKSSDSPNNQKSSTTVHFRSRFPSFSFNKKSESADTGQTPVTHSQSVKATPYAPGYKNNLTPLSSQPNPNHRSSMGQNLRRPFSMISSSQNNLEVSIPPANHFLQKPKKPRRKTFGIFSAREKKMSSPSSPLYPHFETDIDQDPKYLRVGRKPRRPSNTEDELPISRQREPVSPDEISFSDTESDNSDTISRSEILGPSTLPPTPIRKDSIPRIILNKDIDNMELGNDEMKDYFEIHTDFSPNPNPTNMSISARIDTRGGKRLSDIGSTGSLMSTKSIPVNLTSLYRPDSLGPLSQNQNRLLGFLLDFQSRIFCSYRKDFPPIEPAFHTQDTGWGCMHRTGQSLLAQAFLCVLLGRDWRVHHSQTGVHISTYRKILRWFMDGPQKEYFYSIHNISRIGVALDKKIGDWFGPTTLAHALKRLSVYHTDCPLSIYVPSENTIYHHEITSLAFGDPESAYSSFSKPKTSWKPVLILLPVRLGIEKLNSHYSSNLKVLFKLPQFVGIAGGRPCRSLYFVAIQDNELLYLDPHFVRPAINFDECHDFPLEDYHTTIVRAMDISEMDPSMLLGFLFKSEKDFDEFCYSVDQEMDMHFPFFTILNACPLPRAWRTNKSFSEESSANEDDEEDDVEDLNNFSAQVEDDHEVLNTLDEIVGCKHEVSFSEEEYLTPNLVCHYSSLSDDNYELL